MIKNKATVKAAVFSAIAILVAYVLRFLPFAPHQTLLVSLAMMVRYAIHIALPVWWCVSLHYRILHTQMRRILLSVGALLIFWLTARTVKYEFLADVTHPLLRYLWYSYYIPMILVPLLGIFIIRLVGKTEDYRLPRRMLWLLSPALALIIAVFTNDWHQLIFRFPKGFALFDSEYTYGFLYYVIMAWFILLGLFFVVALLRKSRVPGSRKMQKLPLVIMLGAIVFWIAYTTLRIKVDLTAFDCVIIVCLLESAIQSGLLHSNTHYRELFTATTLPVWIVDEDYQPHYVSGGARPLPKDTLRQTENGTVHMGDSILDSSPIRLGRVAWQSDVGRLNALKEHLDSVCEQLSEENTLLQAEVELKERKAKTDEKNRLYDRIAFEVSTQLDRIDALLKQAKADPANRRPLMAKVGVIGSYIKRRGNLVLLSEDHRTIPSRELEFCLRESTDNLDLCNAHTFLDCKQSGEVPVETAIVAYDFFEAVIERVLDELTAVLVHLSCDSEGITVRLQLGLSAPVAASVFFDIPLKNGRYRCDVQDEDVVIDLDIREGGAL